MKNILIAILLVSVLNLNHTKVFAALPVIDFETNWATAVSAGANLVSSAAEEAFTASWFSEIGLDIAANIAKHAAVKELAASVTSWATGGFQGDPTFPINPEKYFKNIETEATRIGLSEITKNGGNLFSDSAVQSVISDFRNKQLPINERIPFTLGSTVQENICNDANLSAMAKNAVGDVLNGTAYSAKKAELANALCSGNASSDKNTQQAMVNVFKENFSTGGGWDSWLALTAECQNEYCIAQKRATEIANEAAKKKELAESELKQGAGSLGIKTCVKYSSGGNNPDEIPDCEEYETQTPGKLVSDQIAESLAGPKNATENAHGHRDFLSLVMDNLMNGVINGFLNEGLASIGAGNGEGLVGNDSYTLTSGSINTTGQPTTISLSQLQNADKSTLLTLLDETTQTITKIDIVNASYLAYLENYVERLDSLNACYDSLAVINPNYSGLGNVPGEKSWVSSQKTDALQKIDLRKKNTDEYYSAKLIITRIKPIIRDSTDTVMVQSAMKEFTDGLTNDTIPHKGKDEILKVDFEGRQKPMNYYLGQKEASCSAMQSQAYNELNVYNSF